MSGGFVPRPDQLSDPAVFRWLMDSIVQAREVHNVGRVGTLQALLDDRVIESALTGPDEVTSFLAFQALDERLLSRFDDSILAAWPGWDGMRALAGAEHLARVAPERFLAILADLLRGFGDGSDPGRLSMLLGALAQIGPAATLPGREALALWGSLPGASKDSSLHLSAVAMAASLGLGELPALLASVQALDWPAAEHPDEPHLGESCLLAAEGAMGGGATFTSALLAVMRRESDLRLAALGDLFEPVAPLAFIDMLIRLPRARSRDRRVGARGLAFRTHPLVTCALAALDAAETRRDISSAAHACLDAFLLAAVAHSWLRPAADLAGRSASDLVDILEADIAILPHEDALVDGLFADEHARDATLAIEAGLWDADGYGAARLARIAGESGDPALVDALLDCMTEDCNDELCEASERALAQLGPSAEQAVIDAWPRLDPSQRIYASGVFERLGSERCVLHLLRTFPEVRGDLSDLETWACTALSVPDMRLLDTLAHEARRQQPEIDDALVTLGALLDVTTPLVMEARERSRVRRQPGGCLLRGLTVQCGACHDQNWCLVPRFWFNERTKEVRLDPEVPCPSCGARGHLAASGFSHLTAEDELKRIRKAEAEGRAYPSPLVVAPEDDEKRSVPAKVGRNDPCACGSGKKFKRCCLLKLN